MKWRPRGWKNPYQLPIGVEDKMGYQYCYEAGADAMLKEIRNKSLRLFDATIKEAGIKLEKEIEVKGTWFFIPDEEVRP